MALMTFLLVSMGNLTADYADSNGQKMIAALLLIGALTIGERVAKASPRPSVGYDWPARTKKTGNFRSMFTLVRPPFDMAAKHGGARTNKSQGRLQN